MALPYFSYILFVRKKSPVPATLRGKGLPKGTNPRKQDGPLEAIPEAAYTDRLIYEPAVSPALDCVSS